MDILIALLFSQNRKLDKVWKLSPVIEQLHSQQLSIVHAKSLTKETKYGAEH